VPEYQVFRDRINHDFMEGYDEEPDGMNACRTGAFRQGEVPRGTAGNQPVGFSGIRMQVMDDCPQQVTDRIWPT
jgi:hypothetical protein